VHLRRAGASPPKHRAPALAFGEAAGGVPLPPGAPPGPLAAPFLGACRGTAGAREHLHYVSGVSLRTYLLNALYHLPFSLLRASMRNNEGNNPRRPACRAAFSPRRSRQPPAAVCPLAHTHQPRSELTGLGYLFQSLTSRSSSWVFGLVSSFGAGFEEYNYHRNRFLFLSTKG